MPARLLMSSGVRTRRMSTVKITIAQPQLPTQELIQDRKLNSISFILGYSLLISV